MEYINKFTGGDNNNNQNNNQQSQQGQNQGGSSNNQGESSGGFLSGIGDKFNSAAGGGKESEKNEDYLDKGKISSIMLQQWLHKSYSIDISSLWSSTPSSG